MQANRVCRTAPLTCGAPRHGFTLVETQFAAGILLVALALGVSATLYIIGSATQDSAQNAVDIDVQTAIERVKTDLRLSALDRMVFYPAGNGPYTAVSFPVTEDSNNDGAVEFDSLGRIIWDRTTIYHVFAVRGETQLRMTTFNPRSSALSRETLQTQLNRVVADGIGTNATYGAQTQTRILLRNPVLWQIVPVGAIYNGYSAVPGRRSDINLGYAYLTAGAHQFQFVCIGRDTRSSGFGIGIDSLFASLSQSAREAESLLPAVSQSGTVPAAAYTPGGSWSGNYQLRFEPPSAGEHFTLSMFNDRWEETNFDHDLGIFDDTVREFDEALSPKDHVVRLEGMTTNWVAADATGDTEGSSDTNDTLSGCAVRVMLRGAEMAYGGHLSANGAKCRVRFRAGGRPGQKLEIEDAYFHRCRFITNDLSPNAASAGVRLKFAGQERVVLNPGQSVRTDWLTFAVDKEMSYFVSFLVNKKKESGGGWGCAWKWQETHSPTNGSTYIWIAADTPDTAEASKDTWSDKLGTKVFQTNVVFAVEELEVSYDALGTFDSQAFDTRMAAPQYTRLDWQSEDPPGTDLKLRIRTASLPDMSDAVDWDHALERTASGAITLTAKRYVQFRAAFIADSTRFLSPTLRNVTVSWQAAPDTVDLGGAFAEGPDRGMYELFVDAKRVVTALGLQLEVRRQARGMNNTRTVTSALKADVRPRNTRR